MEPLPLDFIPSEANYVVLSPEKEIVSEHPTAGEAVQTFSKYVWKTGKQGAIYKRTVKEWMVF